MDTSAISRDWPRAMSDLVAEPLAARQAGPSNDLLEQVAGALPGASQESHRLLAGSAQRRTLEADEIAFRQGDPISLTLTLRGHAAFRRTTADGRELVLGIASPGLLFGFSSIAGMLAGVDLVSVTPIEIAVWPGDEVRRLVRDDPGLTLDVVDGMARYIAAITDRFDPIRQALVAGILHFAASVGLLIIAEGVETESERQTLAGLGVEFGQGYLFGRPAPAGSLRAN